MSPLADVVRVRHTLSSFFFTVFSLPYSCLTKFINLMGVVLTFFCRGTFHLQGFEVQRVARLSGMLSHFFEDEKCSSGNN